MQNSSVLLVQADEGVSVLVVDRIGDIYRSLPRRADVIVTTVGARHKCQQGNRSARPVHQPANHIKSPLYHGLSTGKSSVRDHRGPSAHHSSAVDTRIRYKTSPTPTKTESHNSKYRKIDFTLLAKPRASPKRHRFCQTDSSAKAALARTPKRRRKGTRLQRLNSNRSQHYNTRNAQNDVAGKTDLSALDNARS
ncbi:hypothetical protein F511_37305 [Dorcoceras hygrometricum]|uniref:Uncharacterized protein n=1 Tax=Dorcoceras hygrometricum TaxID=472368 RepID=A0A2Z7AKI9_9LAMI|nr:hypothetical protein F511_37305 [Dorcoceras hygrometricum]